MLNEELTQRIYAHPEMRKIPVGYYSTVANVIADILEDVKKENRQSKKVSKSKGNEESKKGGEDNE